MKVRARVRLNNKNAVKVSFDGSLGVRGTWVATVIFTVKMQVK